MIASIVNSTVTVDYSPVNQNLTFSSTESICVDVVVVDDTILEDIEKFQITLSSSDPSVLIGDIRVASIIISDNDGMLSKIEKVFDLQPFSHSGGSITAD